MNNKWVVIYRKSWTQSVTQPHQFFSTKEEAEQVAADFNKTNQDRTWNYEVAIVHNMDEPLRA